MAESTPYKLSMTGPEADSGIQAGMQAGATAGVLFGDGRGGVRAGTPGADFGFVTLKGNGPPRADTAANLGQFYFDAMATDIPFLYVCVGYGSSGFIWATVGSEVISGDGGASDDGGSPVPPHGTEGQALIKLSDASGDYGWGSVSAITAGAVGTTEMADEAVSSAKMRKNSVTEAILADNAATAEKIQKGAVSTTYAITIPATDWLSEADGVYINIAVAGLTAEDEPIPGVNYAAMASGGSAAALMEAASVVYRFEALADTLRVHATEVPAIPIPVKFKVVRK